METTWDRVGGTGWRGQSMEQEGDTPDLRTVEHVSFQYSFTED